MPSVLINEATGSAFNVTLQSGRLVYSIAGPGWDYSWTINRPRWRRGGKKKGKKGPRPRKPRDLFPWQLASPDTRNADCDAWKTADAAYGSLPQFVKDEWRRHRVGRFTSTYDKYMRQVIPHLLRGIPAYTRPLDALRRRLHDLYNPTPGTIRSAPFYEYLQPPPSCQTHCTYWAQARLATRIWDPPYTYPDDYFAQYEVHYTDIQRPRPHFAWVRYRLHRPILGHVPPWSPWRSTELGYQRNTIFDPNYISAIELEVAQPLRNDDGSLADPYGPDPDRTQAIFFLTSQTELQHWPRIWPSTRCKSTPIPDPSYWDLAPEPYWRYYPY